MKEILSSRSKRQLELIELLIANEWVTFAAASESLNVPAKTLKSDIVELEPLLAPTTIEFSKKYGIRLAINFGFCKTSIYQKFLNNSVEFQLIEKIFLHNFSTIIDLADDLYTSVSTIKRIVLRANQHLQVEGFTINLKKMQLVGDPHSICNFMQHYFYEKYGVADSLLTPAQLVILDQISLQIIDKAVQGKPIKHLDFSLLNQLRFYTYTTINLLKNNSDNLLCNIEEKEFAILNDTYACNEFYRQFQLSLSSKNLNTIFRLYFHCTYIDSIESLQHAITLSRHAYLKYQKINSLIRDIEKKMNCECLNSEELILRLYNLDAQIHGRTFILHDKNKEFFLGIKNLYGHFPMEIIQSLQAIFYLNPHKDFIVYEAISILFTQWPTLLDRLECSTPAMKAALLFNSGLEYMTMLSERINYYLRGRFLCTPLQISSLEELDEVAENFDCIVTNIPEIQIEDMPTIIIPLIPDAKSFDKLMLVYEHHFKKNTIK